MSSNSKIRARKDKAADKSARWLNRFRRNLNKVLSTGDVPSHYVGGGQAYTRGKSN